MVPPFRSTSMNLNAQPMTESPRTSRSDPGDRMSPQQWICKSALACETVLRIPLCHFPPGTNRSNKIEYRTNRHITGTWRGRLCQL